MSCYLVLFLKSNWSSASLEVLCRFFFLGSLAKSEKFLCPSGNRCKKGCYCLSLYGRSNQGTAFFKHGLICIHDDPIDNVEGIGANGTLSTFRINLRCFLSFAEIQEKYTGHAKGDGEILASLIQTILQITPMTMLCTSHLYWMLGLEPVSSYKLNSMELFPNSRLEPIQILHLVKI